MYKIFILIAILLMLIPNLLIAQSIIVLSDEFPNTTIESGDDAIIYGSQQANIITIEKAGKAEFVNAVGENSIIINSSSNQFTVIRYGALVTFEGEDGTVLSLPATSTSQAICFDDISVSLIVNSNQVILGNQEVNLLPSPIVISLETQITIDGYSDDWDK